MKLLAAGMLMIALILVQSWRLHQAHNTITQQHEALQSNNAKLADKNSQLIALSVLTETNSQAQAALYAAAEKNSSQLREKLRAIEELTHENETLRSWANAVLPSDVIRLQQRPTFTRGEDYRQWLSENHGLSAGQKHTQNKRAALGGTQ